MRIKLLRTAILGTVAAVGLSGCGFSPYALPLPGGADLGDEPYTVTVQFRDVLDLVPQSAVRVNDIAVGKVTDIKLDGWTAMVTLDVNKDAKLPDNTQATIRQTSLLGEKFVSLDAPANGAIGQLSNGDKIPLDRSGRNPEIEEVLGAASLLFNGGGLEKTNTIVKELNNALDGNESDVKELIGSTSTFLGQLDDNKEALLTSLEKVDRLAVAVNGQKKSITGALDNLPEALRVVNGQRDDLVTLLQSLDRLSDVATGVIRESKADTIADLKALMPTLRNLSESGDDLATATRALLSYPFTDGFVGNSLAKASGKCEGAGEDAIKRGACFGDFANLSASLDIGVEQLCNLLALPEEGQQIPCGADGIDLSGLPGADALAPAAGNDKPLPTESLVDLVGGLTASDGLPDLGGLTGQKPAPKSTGDTGTPGAGASDAPSEGSDSGGFCSLLGMCRAEVAETEVTNTDVANTDVANTVPSDDLARLVLEPVVAP